MSWKGRHSLTLLPLHPRRDIFPFCFMFGTRGPCITSESAANWVLCHDLQVPEGFLVFVFLFLPAEIPLEEVIPTEYKCT